MNIQYWYINGQAYDLTEFIPYHPGGEVLLTARGLDITQLIHSHHPIHTPSLTMIEKYRRPESDIQESADSQPYPFTWEENGFAETVKRRVKKHFSPFPGTYDSTKASDAHILMQTIITATVIMLIYPSLVLCNPIFAFFYGIFRGMISVCLGHSASHNSFTRNGKINEYVTYMTAIFGTSTPDIWNLTHNLSHHLELATLKDVQTIYLWKRSTPLTKIYFWIQKYQHIYIWFIYIFAVIFWTLQDLLDSLKELFITRRNRLGLLTNYSTQFSNIGFLLIQIFWILLPFLSNGVNLKSISAFIIVYFSMSFVLVFEIVVNHEIPEVVDAIKETHTALPMDWGVYQVLTSHNFSSNSLFWLHLSGGLNMQIEHHLFPTIHYIHYPAIRKIILDACKEFNIPYHESNNLFEGLVKHYTVLKRYGSEIKSE